MSTDPEEVRRLRAALRDLVALSTIPAAWVGREPAMIAAGLADVLVGSLRLDFAFVRLSDPAGGAAVDVARGTAWKSFPEWLQRHLDASGGRISHKEVVPDVGGGVERCPGLVMPIGVIADAGLVAVACERADFPTETDQLLLSVAANHGAIAFQSARLIHERRLAEEQLCQARDELARNAEESLRQARAELAHVARVTSLGELVSSIAHEINQPLAAIVADAAASLNWLTQPDPDLDMVCEALDDIVTEGHRAGDVIHRIRRLATKSEPQKTRLEINDVIQEVAALVRSEVHRHRASLHLALAPALPAALGDRVQLQQVILNLAMNGVEAMESVDDRPRELVIRSEAQDGDRVLVAVQDTGVGLDPSQVDRLFQAFFTTKPAGMGMGLSISRSIIEGHGGRLWATPNPTHGATFQFELPVTR